MRTILAVLFSLLGSLLAPACAQVPPPIPALPDTERRTTYAITAQTGPFPVNFQIYGDGTDYQNWVEVWLNGVRLGAPSQWQLSLTSGTLATSARPLQNAQVTLTTASTGTLQIVGARRPRRLSQFSENQPLSARNLNQALTDIIAENRETWDRTNDVSGRALMAPPGEILSVLPPAAGRSGLLLSFDAGGQPIMTNGSTVVTTIGTGMLGFPTRASAQAATIALAVNTLLISGYAAAGDAPLATYVRIACTAVVAWGFQSADKLDSGGATCTGTNINWILKAPVLHVQQFGGKCDGATNDATAFQNLINAGIALGLPARFSTLGPPGFCVVNSSLTINGSIDFGGSFIGYGLSQQQGHGAFSTGAFLQFPANTNAIVVDTPKPVKLHDFGLFGSGVSASGAGIVVTDSSGYVNQNSIFDNLFITSFFSCFEMDNGAVFKLINSTLTSCTGTGALIKDVFNPDGGDSVIAATEFDMSSATVDAVTYESGGGLKFWGNKINSARIGLKLNLFSGVVNTGILNVFGNSIENVDTAIQLKRGLTTGSFYAVQISGNHLRANVTTIEIPTDATGRWISDVVITGNSLICSVACVAADSVSGITVVGNMYHNGGVGTARPVILLSNILGGHVGLGPINGSFNPNSLAGTSVTEEMRNEITIPVLTGCGAGPSPTIDGTSASGEVVIGGGATTCTITFGTPYLNRVFCTVSNHSGTGVLYNAATLAAIVITGGVAAGNRISYTCNGR